MPFYCWFYFLCIFMNLSGRLPLWNKSFVYSVVVQPLLTLDQVHKVHRSVFILDLDCRIEGDYNSVVNRKVGEQNN